jgi:chromosome segregation ATPase
VVKKDYSVTAGIMELPTGKCFEVGSREWWDWLNSSDAESFRFDCDFGAKGYRARKEEIKARSGSFWYAYKRIEGKLRKRYLGKSEELSLERLESIAYDLAKPVEARSEVELPNKSVGNYSTDELIEALQQQRANAVERENCYQQLLEQKIRLEKQVQELSELHNTLGNCQDELRELKHHCTHLENENNRLTRLGQDYSQATVAKLSQKYTKALNDVQHWKESSESYQRQAAKLKAELDELPNTLGNQQSPLELLEEYLSQIGGIPVDEKGKPKARYDQLAKFYTWLSERTT